jgi:hypothetical protein
MKSSNAVSNSGGLKPIIGACGLKQTIGDSCMDDLKRIQSKVISLTELLEQRAVGVMLPCSPLPSEVIDTVLHSGQPFFDALRDKIKSINDALDNLDIEISRIEV